MSPRCRALPPLWACHPGNATAVLTWTGARRPTPGGAAITITSYRIFGDTTVGTLPTTPIGMGGHTPCQFSSGISTNRVSGLTDETTCFFVRALNLMGSRAASNEAAIVPSDPQHPLVGSDGGILTFGDAAFLGSEGQAVGPARHG